MRQDTENAVQALLSNISDFDANVSEGIDAAKRAFQEAYEANSAEVPREKFLSDLERLNQTAELFSNSSDLSDQYHVLTQHYMPLIDELKQRYGDFISDEISQNLTDLIMRPTALFKIIEAQSIMVRAMRDLQEPKDQARMLYTGIVTVSEAIEKYAHYFSIRLREHLRTMAKMFLSDPAFNPDDYISDQSAYSCMISFRNTARSILWQLDSYQEKTKYTVKGLLEWVETNAGWAGDDFEECLDYVNRARKG